MLLQHALHAAPEALLLQHAPHNLILFMSHLQVCRSKGSVWTEADMEDVMAEQGEADLLNELGLNDGADTHVPADQQHTTEAEEDLEPECSLGWDAGSPQDDITPLPVRCAQAGAVLVDNPAYLTASGKRRANGTRPVVLWAARYVRQHYGLFFQGSPLLMPLFPLVSVVQHAGACWAASRCYLRMASCKLCTLRFRPYVHGHAMQGPCKPTSRTACLHGNHSPTTMRMDASHGHGTISNHT